MISLKGLNNTQIILYPVTRQEKLLLRARTSMCRTGENQEA